MMGTVPAFHSARHRGKAVGLLLLLAALVLASRHSLSVKDGNVGRLSWLAARALPAQGTGGGGHPRHVYLLANSPAANATWREMQVGKDDILVGAVCLREAGRTFHA